MFYNTMVNGISVGRLFHSHSERRSCYCVQKRLFLTMEITNIDLSTLSFLLLDASFFLSLFFRLFYKHFHPAFLPLGCLCRSRFNKFLYPPLSRWLSLFLSLYFPLSMSTSLSPALSIYLSMHSPSFPLSSHSFSISLSQARQTRHLAPSLSFFFIDLLYRHACLSIVSVCLPAYLSVHLSVYLSVCLSISPLPVCLPACISLSITFCLPVYSPARCSYPRTSVFSGYPSFFFP